MTVRRATCFLALTGLLLVGVACGDDDGGEVRELGGDASSGSGSGGSGSGGSGSGSGASGSGSSEVACAPVGEDLEASADQTVEVDLSDYAFDPQDIEVGAGTVTFATTNTGEENHEMAFLPGGGEVPFVEPGVPDEDALAEAGAFELEGYSPGQSCNATYELEPGTYTVFCIVGSGDGATHYEKGMAGELVVS
jgi:plastocyanin